MGFEIVREIPYEGTPGLRRVWPALFAAGVVYVPRDRRATSWHRAIEAG
jgi:hypothetical protein